MQLITPFLWFDNQAEEAAKYYISVFLKKKGAKKSEHKITSIAYYEEAAAGMPRGSVLCVNFRLAGQEFVALNGGPRFPFTEAVSFVIDCKNQEEVDYFWNTLTEDGGEESMCGWLKDKYGLSWQVTPTILNKMLLSKDKPKARKAMQAMMKMRKIDVAALKKAFK